MNVKNNPIVKKLAASSTGNDLARLGEEYLQASKMLNDGFKSVPKWPTYQNASWHWRIF
jgi:hypothetical protein